MRNVTKCVGSLLFAGTILAAPGAAQERQEFPETQRSLERELAAMQSFRALELGFNQTMTFSRPWPESHRILRRSTDPRAAACPEAELELRTMALMGLARDEEGGVPIVVEILWGEEPCQIALREAALAVLGRWRSEPAVGALIRLLEGNGHPDVEVRRSALYQLTRVESSRALDAMLHVALSDPDTDVRNIAFMHLGRSDDPRAAEALRRALTANDATEESRIMAARALARSDREADRAALVAAFRDSDNPRFRQTILTSLAANGSNVELLIEVARSERDEDLRRIAVTLLSRSDDPRARALLREIARGGGG